MVHTHCRCGASAPSVDFVKENSLPTFVFFTFTSLFVLCFVLFFFFAPPLLSLAASGLQKHGDITTTGRLGRGGGKMDGAEGGREGYNKVPLSAVKPVWALCSECVRTCAHW